MAFSSRLVQTRCSIRRSPCHLRQFPDLHLDGAVGHGRGKLAQRVLDQRCHVGFRRLDCLPTDARERQDVVDQMPHPGGAIRTTCRIRLPSVSSLSAYSFTRICEKPSIARNGVRRSCDTEYANDIQFPVGDLQALVGLRQIGGARGDQFLEVLVVAAPVRSTRRRCVTSWAAANMPATSPFSSW